MLTYFNLLKVIDEHGSMADDGCIVMENVEVPLQVNAIVTLHRASGDSVKVRIGHIEYVVYSETLGERERTTHTEQQITAYVI